MRIFIWQKWSMPLFNNLLQNCWCVLFAQLERNGVCLKEGVWGRFVHCWVSLSLLAGLGLEDLYKRNNPLLHGLAVDSRSSRDCLFVSNFYWFLLLFLLWFLEDANQKLKWSAGQQKSLRWTLPNEEWERVRRSSGDARPSSRHCKRAGQRINHQWF